MERFLLQTNGAQKNIKSDTDKKRAYYKYI